LGIGLGIEIDIGLDIEIGRLGIETGAACGHSLKAEPGGHGRNEPSREDEQD